MNMGHVAVWIMAAVGFLTVLQGVPDGESIPRSVWIGASIQALGAIGGTFMKGIRSKRKRTRSYDDVLRERYSKS